MLVSGCSATTKRQSKTKKTDFRLKGRFFAVSHFRKTTTKEQLDTLPHLHSNVKHTTFSIILAALFSFAKLIAHDSLHNGLTGQPHYGTHGVQAKFKSFQYIYLKSVQQSDHFYCDADVFTSLITMKVTLLPFLRPFIILST